MNKIFLPLFYFIFSISVFAQYEIEEFKPLPTGIEKIKAIHYSNNKLDTTSENYLEYIFDKRGNLTGFKFFPLEIEKEIEYDSLNRVIQIKIQKESFGDVIIKYYYTKDEEVNISYYDRTGYYTYIKSKFIFDSMNRINTEILYDSTFNYIDSSLSVTRKYINYSYDTQGNKIEELHSNYLTKELIYKMQAVYQDKKLMNKIEYHFNPKSITQAYRINLEENVYVKEGEFEGRLAEKNSTSIYNDSIKSKIHYSYKRIDSSTIIQENRYFDNQDLRKVARYFYIKNRLVKLEEYFIIEQENEEKQKIAEEIELQLPPNRTEYTYLFYPNNNESDE